MRKYYPDSGIEKNIYFILMCLVGIFGSADAAMAGSMIYYVKYVLCNMDLVGVISMVTLASTLAGVSAVQLISRKICAKSLVIGGIALKIITYAINLAFPANLPLFIIFTAVRGLAGAPMMVYSGVFLLNTIEYGVRKTGIRANNLIIAVSSVFGKIGSGLGGALTGWLLSLGGYAAVAYAKGKRAVISRVSTRKFLHEYEWTSSNNLSERKTYVFG